MIFETKRLILRQWENSDAEELYKYAKDPLVGPIAGWPPHTSVENSLEIIRSVLAEPETYAVVLKETNRVVGSVGIMFAGKGSAPMKENEAEIGYWIGVPYWGQGLIPEAVRKLQERCFTELGCNAVWCGYYDGNDKSRRVQEKSGFSFHHTEKSIITPMNDIRTEHFTYLTKAEWQRNRNDIPAPCGAVCAECEKHSKECAGCRKIKGKVWWLEYTGQPICDFYKCCIVERELVNCGKCENFPCDIFRHGDPTKSDKENAEILKQQIETLTAYES